MTTTSLTLTYGLASTETQPLDLLKLEQEEWSVYTGSVTKQEMVRWIAAALTGDEYQSQIDCGMAGDALVCTLYAYPRVAGLNYRLLTSWGTLSGRAVEMLELSELVQFRLTTSESTRYPVRRILAVDWADECYGPGGEVVSAPELIADSEAVTCAEPVYGTAQVKYLCERHTVILNAPRREAARDNNYSAVVVGVYEGGLAHLVVEMPPSVEVFEADPDAVCGLNWTTQGTITSPDEEVPVQPSTASRETVIDYCTQKVISDTYY
jgi:hypothetical protein